MKTNSEIAKILGQLGIEELNQGVCTGTVWPETGGDRLTSYSPADGQPIADIKQADLRDYERVVRSGR